MIKGLSAWCKLNTTYMDLAKQEYAKDQPLYRCLNKTTPAVEVSLAVMQNFSMLGMTVLIIVSVIYSF